VPGVHKALDAEPPIASFVKSMLIGGGPVNASVRIESATEREQQLCHRKQVYVNCSLQSR
jgi:hypothetical protein